MPPLNALRAFEAAARHEGFAKAASELGVTPAAVSQQVKALEQWLKTPLFKRRAQGLELTEGGRALAPSFTCAFDALGAAVQEMRAAAPYAHVHIAALPSIAQLWLMPRLKDLRASLPGMTPSIHALETPPNFRREPFDLAIFFLPREMIGPDRISLETDVIFPVCNPEIARGLRSERNLRDLPLLYDTTWKDDWRIWGAEAGLPDLDVRDGMAFSLYSAALQAAIDGVGVLVGHQALVAGPLKAGALVAPFDKKAVTNRSLALILPKRRSAHTSSVAEHLIRSADGQRPD